MNLNDGSLYTQMQLSRERDIRLVKVLLTEDKALKCEVKIANLDDKPHYFAISYTWGPSTAEEAARGVTNQLTHDLTCNDYQVRVTSNLHAFLARASRRPELTSKYLWIDSICIDQRASLEQTSQVSMMADIYISAERVIVWLGEEDEDTSSAFSLIQALARLPSDHLQRITPQNYTDTQILEMTRPYGGTSYWRSMVRLFQRKYFVRLWIIQEITLGRKRWTICGEQSVDWEDIVTVSHFLTVSSWNRWIYSERAVRMDEYHLSGHSIPNLLEANKRTKLKDESKLLLYSLIRSRRFLASDPRDKVYGLLGVSGTQVIGKDRYKPVYGERSAATTYEKAAVQILLDSDDLLVLAQAEGECFQNTPGLPSWVPDWNTNRVVGLGITGYERFWAAGTIPRILEIDEENHALVVSGKLIASVSAVSETKEQVLKGEPFPRLLSMLCALPRPYHTGQRPSEVFWRTLITDTAGYPYQTPTPDHYSTAFLTWFRSRLNHMATRVNESLLAQVFECLRADGLYIPTLDLSEPFQDNTPENGPYMPTAGDYETTLSHSQHLRAFLSKENYLGLCSESLRVDDEIWVLAGSRVPLALRPAGQNVYTVVGGTYIHGLMHGEAVTVENSFKRLTLV